MGLFDKLKRNKKAEQSSEKSTYHLTLQINARLQPLDRGDIYEDPIAAALEVCACGTTSGGGTMMHKGGEIVYCDVEIELNDNSKDSMDKLLGVLDEVHLPKGSLLISDNLERPIGTLEGLALYMNGTELSDDVYSTCDINYVIEKVNELLAGAGKMYSHWQGP